MQMKKEQKRKRKRRRRRDSNKKDRLGKWKIEQEGMERRGGRSGLPATPLLLPFCPYFMHHTHTHTNIQASFAIFLFSFLFPLYPYLWIFPITLNFFSPPIHS